MRKIALMAGFILWLAPASLVLAETTITVNDDGNTVTTVQQNTTLCDPSQQTNCLQTVSQTIQQQPTTTAPDTPKTNPKNQTPVASAGSNRGTTTSSTVTLDGSASSDPDRDPLAYTWSLTSKPAGSTATIAKPNITKPNFTPDVVGTYVVTLTVSDGLASATATVSITATTSTAAFVCGRRPGWRRASSR